MVSFDPTALPLPTPAFDHVAVNVRDGLDEAQATYERLGFTLTPRGYHALGSVNHLAVFATDYIELLAVGSSASFRRDLMAEPQGLSGIAFATQDSIAVYRALATSGLTITPPIEFVRPVELPDRTADARFRIVHVRPQAGRPGRLSFCHHLTRELVWRDEWRRHANGAVGVVRAVIASDDPAILEDVFACLFGTDATHPIEGGIALTVGVSRIDVLRHDAAAAQLGDAAADAAGRAHYMAALTLRTKQLGMVRAALAAGGVAGIEQPGRIWVPAASAAGCPIEFVP